MFETIILAELVSTIVYTLLGAGLLGLLWLLIDRLTPFSAIKEIEEDQNVALAILIGFFFLSLSIIIAAVIVS